MKGQLFLLHQKNLSLFYLFVNTKGLPRRLKYQTVKGGGSRNGKKCARKGFLPLNYSRKLVQIFVQSLDNVTYNHENGIHNLDILGQTNFNDFVKKKNYIFTFLDLVDFDPILKFKDTPNTILTLVWSFIQSI